MALAVIFVAMLSSLFLGTSIERFINGLSLRTILYAAIFIRLIAAFFSIGYGMHDDHYYVIEVAQSWADGGNVGGWLPWVEPGQTPDVSHSLFYPGIHFLLFKLMNGLGPHDPQIKMLLVRILHAFYSTLIVYFGFKITEKLADKNTAKWCGLFLALLWFMPYLSVRNLVEMVCIPPLMGAFWLLLKKDEPQWWHYLLAGFVVGFAFSIRYQTALFIGGIGLALLIKQQWRGAILFGTAAIINVLLFQGLTDFIIWGKPFAEFLGYLQYNVVHKNDFTTGPWYNYILLILGLALPPFSVVLWYGYFKNISRNLLLFIPTFIFLAFHSYFINKQERFILPFVPFFIILGLAGSKDLAPAFIFEKNRKRTFQIIGFTLLSLNLLLLLIASVSSSKTSRMNAMYYLYEQKDAKGYILEASGTYGWLLFPKFYAGQWLPEFQVSSDHHASDVKTDIGWQPVKPNYVIFLSDKDLDRRLQEFKQVFPNIEYKTTIQPAFMDRLFHKLNPINKNEPCYIYKLGEQP